MPQLGGLALARSISQLRPETRILFISGHAEHAHVPGSQESLPAGTEFLQKPFTREVLIRRVSQVLDPAPV
jgi:FixJ family two-component response regulator